MNELGQLIERGRRQLNLHPEENLSDIDPSRANRGPMVSPRVFLETLQAVESLRVANRHFREMLKCPDCGKQIWECKAHIVGCGSNIQ